MTATDADAGLYGQVSYSIQSPQIAKDTFKIDSNGKLNISGIFEGVGFFSKATLSMGRFLNVSVDEFLIKGLNEISE